MVEVYSTTRAKDPVLRSACAYAGGGLGFLALGLFLPPALNAQETYDAIVTGMSCRQNVVRSIECSYRVGRDLEFLIYGVGEVDAGITFLRSSGTDGDYYAIFSLLHGCVTVAPGTARLPRTAGDDSDFAFVSPYDGKAYRKWENCYHARDRPTP